MSWELVWRDEDSLIAAAPDLTTVRADFARLGAAQQQEILAHMRFMRAYRWFEAEYARSLAIQENYAHTQAELAVLRPRFAALSTDQQDALLLEMRATIGMGALERRLNYGVALNLGR